MTFEGMSFRSFRVYFKTMILFDLVHHRLQCMVTVRYRSVRVRRNNMINSQQEIQEGVLVCLVLIS